MELNVNTRSKEKLQELSPKGMVPAILYGKHLKGPMSLSCGKNDFLKRYREAGYSMPITLKGDGIEQMVLIQDIQVDPVSDALMHIDFLAIKAGEKVTTNVLIKITGESPLEKLGEAKIQLVKDSVEIEALPKDLIQDITIDISDIKEMSEKIFVKDLKVGDEITILDDPEQAVLTVVALDEEEEEEVPITTEGGEEGEEGEEGAEGEEGEKKEGEEAKEGEKGEKKEGGKAKKGEKKGEDKK